MKHQHLEKYNMCKALKQTLATTAADYAGYAPFLTAVTAFNTQLTAWDALIPPTANTTTGVTATKKQAKSDMATYWSALAHTTNAYAQATNNLTLQAATNHKTTEITHLPDADALALCQNLRTTINTNLAPLAPYGITATHITTGDAKITTFANLLGQAGSLQSLSEAQNQLIANHIKNNINPILKQLDSLTNGINFTAKPAFVATYHNARELTPIATLHTTLTITATNATTAQPIADAIITLAGTTKTATTNPLGIATLQQFTGGNALQFTITHPLYQTLQLLLDIPTGKHITQATPMTLK